MQWPERLLINVDKQIVETGSEEVKSLHYLIVLYKGSNQINVFKGNKELLEALPNKDIKASDRLDDGTVEFTYARGVKYSYKVIYAYMGDELGQVCPKCGSNFITVLRTRHGCKSCGYKVKEAKK